MTALLDGMSLSLTKTKSRGNPPKYPTTDSLIEATQDYYNYIKDNNDRGIRLIPDIEGLCAYIGITRAALNKWEHERDENYRDTVSMIKNQIAAMKKQLALMGKIPPIVFATDFNNNHGYVQKQTVDMTVQPKNALGDDVSNEELMQKYKEGIPEDNVIATFDE